MTELLNTLYVQTQGAGLYLDHDTVKIVTPDGRGRQALPLRRLDAIIVYGHVNVSTELLARCAKDGRTVTWMTQSGRFLARADGPVRGNVLLRHAQHLAYSDPARRLGIARSCVAGKIQNSRQVLLRAARDAEPPRQSELRRIASNLAAQLPATATASALDELLGTEGQAARLYYRGFASLLRTGPAMLGRRVPAALLPAIQARLLARHLRDELPSYIPWLVS